MQFRQKDKLCHHINHYFNQSKFTLYQQFILKYIYKIYLMMQNIFFSFSIRIFRVNLKSHSSWAAHQPPTNDGLNPSPHMAQDQPQC